MTRITDASIWLDAFGAEGRRLRGLRRAVVARKEKAALSECLSEYFAWRFHGAVAALGNCFRHLVWEQAFRNEGFRLWGLSEPARRSVAFAARENAAFARLCGLVRDIARAQAEARVAAWLDAFEAEGYRLCRLSEPARRTAAVLRREKAAFGLLRESLRKLRRAHEALATSAMSAKEALAALGTGFRCLNWQDAFRAEGIWLDRVAKGTPWR